MACDKVISQRATPSGWNLITKNDVTADQSFVPRVVPPRLEKRKESFYPVRMFIALNRCLAKLPSKRRQAVCCRILRFVQTWKLSRPLRQVLTTIKFLHKIKSKWKRHASFVCKKCQVLQVQSF